MKRVLMLVWLVASPALADVEVVFTPSRPNSYSSYSSSSYWNRSFASPIRSDLHGGMRSARINYFGTRATVSPSPAPGTGIYTARARFGYHPHYPSYPSAYVFNKSLLAPAPLASGPPPCDPYLDDDGCLSEIAGWQSQSLVPSIR